MQAIRKVIQKRGRSTDKSKHEKLPENWGQTTDAVRDDVVFHTKYLGSTLVEEIPDGQSYGDHISSEAVKTIVAMARQSGKKLEKMAINISHNGIKVTNMATHNVLTDMDIYRICFCTADKTHDKVFAYIARSKENETMECHAFLCSKRKIAQAITLTVAESFQMAKEDYVQLEEDKKILIERQAFGDAPDKKDLVDQPLGFEDNFSGFEDNFADIVAKQNIKSDNPFAQSKFSSGVNLHEVDESVIQLMQGGSSNNNTGNLHKPPSVDDLLLL